MPLAFVGNQTLRWGGEKGDRFSYKGTYVTEGTTPAGSMWSMNPIPRNDVDQTGVGFKQRCPAGVSDRPCSGGTETGLGNLEIVDVIQIPAGTPEGNYVLGWRWDCEESNQIWSSCSDVTIAA